MNLRVGFVLNSVGPTSGEADIARAINELDHVTVDIIAWFSADPFYGEAELDLTCLAAPRSLLGFNRAVYQQARTALDRVDIVQVHHNHSGSLATLVARRLGKPVVSREGNTRDGFTRKGRLANGLTNVFADRIVCNSPIVYDSFTRWERLLIDDEDVKIIPNGFDQDRVASILSADNNVRAEFGVDSNVILVGSAGNLYEQKGYDVAIEAIARANAHSDRRFEMIIAGEGPERVTLESLVNSLEMNGHIQLPGTLPREGVYSLMDELDIFAMPSRWEGLANAAVEALGIGNAAVFSDIEQFREPFEEVALFHPVDDVEGMADQLMAFGEDQNLRTEYADRGRELIREEYLIDRVVSAYVKLYENILGR